MLNFLLRMFSAKECHRVENELGINIFVCEPAKKVKKS